MCVFGITNLRNSKLHPTFLMLYSNLENLAGAPATAPAERPPSAATSPHDPRGAGEEERGGGRGGDGEDGRWEGITG